MRDFLFEKLLNSFKLGHYCIESVNLTLYFHLQM